MRRGAAFALAATLLGGLAVPGTAAAVDLAPSGLAPDDAESAPLRKNLELSWAPVTGALSYTVQVSDDDSFPPDSVLEAKTTIPYWTPPVQLPRGGYFWRVAATTVDGQSSWSDTATFTRGWDRSVEPGNPHIVAPITAYGLNPDGERILLPPVSEARKSKGHVDLYPGALPSFTWEPIPGASFYEIEVSNRPLDETFPPYTGTDDKFRFTCYTQRTWFAPYGVVAGKSDAPGDEANCALGMSSEPAPKDGTIGDSYHGDQVYYWRVRGRDGTSDTRETPFAKPALSCAGVWEGAGGTLNPPPEDDEEPDPDRPEFVYRIPSTPPSYLAHPECSQWAHGGSFSVLPYGQADVDGTPTGLTAQPTAGDPAASLVTVTSTPVLSWNAVERALKYRVYLSRTADFTDSDVVYETHATSLSPAHSFADRAAPTYWTVQACGAIGCGSAATGKRFQKRSWNAVRPLDKTTTGPMTTFRWSTQWTGDYHPSSPAVPLDDQAMSYQLQVRHVDGTFSNPLVDVKVDHAGSDPKQSYWRSPTAELPPYHVWRVRAVDETGRAWAWAYSKPYAKIVSAPGFGLAEPVTVEFTSPVTGVTSSSLRLRDSRGAVVPGAVSRLSERRFQFLPTASWTAGESYDLALSADVKDANGFVPEVVPVKVRAATLVDSASAALSTNDGDYGWQTVRASDARGGSYLRTKAGTGTNASVVTTVVGTAVTFRACKSPRSGYADILVNGVKVKRVNLYRSYSGCGAVWTSESGAVGHRVVTVKATGKKSSRSKGADVAVDAIRVH